MPFAICGVDISVVRSLRISQARPVTYLTSGCQRAAVRLAWLRRGSQRLEGGLGALEHLSRKHDGLVSFPWFSLRLVLVNTSVVSNKGSVY